MGCPIQTCNEQEVNKLLSSHSCRQQVQFHTSALPPHGHPFLLICWSVYFQFALTLVSFWNPSREREPYKDKILLCQVIPGTSVTVPLQVSLSCDPGTGNPQNGKHSSQPPSKVRVGSRISLLPDNVSRARHTILPQRHCHCASLCCG